MELITLDNSVAFLGFLPLFISLIKAFKKGNYIDSDVVLSFIIGLIILILTIVDHSQKKTNDLANKKHSDSLDNVIISINIKYDKHEKKDFLHDLSDSLHGLKFDTANNALRIIDSELVKALLKKQTPVILDEKPGLQLAKNLSANPTFTIVGDSIWKFNLALTAKSKESARNLKDKNYNVLKRSGVFALWSKTINIGGNENTVIDEAGENILYSGSFKNYPLNLSNNDTLFAFVIINFTNFKGVAQPPLGECI